MFTPPADLPEVVVADALHAGWGFAASSLRYQAVGFGSHHWLATAADGARLFATVDDLAAKLRTADDRTDDAYARLATAFKTARSLRVDAGLEFVVAPRLASDGRVLRRLADRYALVVHPYVVGTRVDNDGEFRSAADRRSMLARLVEIHRAKCPVALMDDFLVPHRHELEQLVNDVGESWADGPYGEPARVLLAANASAVSRLLSVYDKLATRVSARPERMVVTHGEPHAGNVIRTSAGFALIDWDTALLAPPERDLWDLAQTEESLLDAYADAAEVAIDPDALSLYRLWYDLAEIGGYLSLFRRAHTDTADAAESWRNLRHFLQPVARWPDLFG